MYAEGMGAARRLEAAAASRIWPKRVVRRGELRGCRRVIWGKMAFGKAEGEGAEN